MLTQLVEAWRSARRFSRLPPRDRQLVFYAEDAASRPHLEPIIRHLTGELGHTLCYLTSNRADPALKRSDPRMRSFYIGAGAVRTILFAGLTARVMVVTMPELEMSYIKRSRACPVRYVYVFHSIVSTHMIYRREAFDHFDVVFLVGPHHEREIRAAEREYRLPVKQLFPHGYGRLDSILAESAAAGRPPRAGGRGRVLLAPSWGPHGLLENHAREIVASILGAGHELVVRPHPMTAKENPGVVEQLRSFRHEPRFSLETDVASSTSLLWADVMVSDWSGAALEFAFGVGRPVLFIDVPRKVRNAEYERLGCEPLEVGIRETAGRVLSTGRLGEAGTVISALDSSAAAWGDRLRKAREAAVYNVGTSGRAGAERLAAMLRAAPRDGFR